jgi:hypothetical protein
MLLAASATADEGPRVVPGQRLRVTAAAPGAFTGVTMGTLAKLGPDSLTLIDPERGTVMELPISSIQRLEVSQGRRRHTRKGLLSGAAVGIAFAAYVWARMSEDPEGCGGRGAPYRACSKGETAAVAATFVAGSAGVGAWRGHRKQTEVWSDSPVERLRITVRPERGGGRIALTLSF